MNTVEMKSFDVLDRGLNVYDSYLLEASAGTGKTFSIENIVVRLLIEGENPLSINKILVVTFTKSAMNDLKNRIRQNIEKALKFFKDAGDSKVPDYIQAIIENGESAVYEAEERLKSALFTFDEAQIFTIHAFCFKMLSTHALESGISLNGVGEEASLLNTEILKIIRNFFRTAIKPGIFSAQQINIVLKKHKSKMEELEKALLKWMTTPYEIAPSLTFQELFCKFKESMRLFSFEKEKIVADFNHQISNYKKLKGHEEGVDKVVAFASLFEKEELLEEDFNLLIEDGLYLLEVLDKSNLKVKAKPILESELFYPHLNQTLQETLLPLIEEARSYEMIFLRMVKICQQMLQTYVSEEDKFRFDDLLKLMNSALKSKSFLHAIRDKYGAGIIDEFQDTDPVQWMTFKEIFYQFSPFYLVGDPKQSIYAFRQADIYTYLKAADLVEAKNRLSLDTNFRSQPSLVHSLNALFEKVHDFIELPYLDKVLEYKCVKPSPSKPEHIFQDDLASLHFFIAEGEAVRNKLPIEEFEEKLYFPFMFCQIQNLKKQGFNLSEIAILVKDRFQATRVFDFLRARNINVALQKVSSLADSPVVSNLIELLSAVISPRDESALKVALGGNLIGFSHLDILDLEDPEKLEEVLEQFFYFRKLLNFNGFFSFFEAFLKSIWKGNLTVAQRLMASQDGLDIYTDLLQIGELLAQHQVEMQCTPDGLLRFLRNFETLDFDQDERLKKLRNLTEEAVQVLTIHSSKGLEFDIVFALGLVNKAKLPGPFMPIRNGDETILAPIQDKTSESYLNYIKELDAEKMRQLYVALTRAKYRLYVPAAFALNVKNEEEELHSGTASCMELFFAKLLGNQNLNSQKLTALLDDLKISYSKLCEMSNAEVENNEEEEVILEIPQAVKLNFEPKFMVSFTNLAKSGMQKKARASPHDFEAEEKSVHTLPAGAKTGILLHSILEALPLEKFGSAERAEELFEFVESFISGTKFEGWKEVIAEMMFNVLNCHLGSFQFKEINPSLIYREKEFIYPNETGYMKGVIDFMFMHEDKYYFIDWKSNFLGIKDEDYEEQSLKEAMEEHDYALQADIYKEAIRKFLHIVDERDFDECFGGIFYVFLRGIQSDKGMQGVYSLRG